MQIGTHGGTRGHREKPVISVFLWLKNHLLIAQPEVVSQFVDHCLADLAMRFARERLTRRIGPRKIAIWSGMRKES